MTYNELKEYCLSKQGAYIDCPFGPFPICFKVGTRIFLEWYPAEDKITVRCDPMLADYYRQRYPNTVVPGYHCPDRQKPYKNTVYLNQDLEDELIYEMLEHSYEQAFRCLKKADRIRINNN